MKWVFTWLSLIVDCNIPFSLQLNCCQVSFHSYITYIFLLMVVVLQSSLGTLCGSVLTLDCSVCSAPCVVCFLHKHLIMVSKWNVFSLLLAVAHYLLHFSLDGLPVILEDMTLSAFCLFPVIFLGILSLLFPSRLLWLHVPEMTSLHNHFDHSWLLHPVIFLFLSIFLFLFPCRTMSYNEFICCVPAFSFFYFHLVSFEVSSCESSSTNSLYCYSSQPFLFSPLVPLSSTSRHRPLLFSL